MIYITQFDENLSENKMTALYEKVSPFLPEAKRIRLENIKNINARFQSMACHLLLAIGIKNEYPQLIDCFKNATYKISPKGKPSFETQSLSGIHYNFSHCKNGVVCAIASEEVGIDIQEVRQITDLMKKKLSSTGSCLLDNADDEEVVMHWTKLEAVSKLKGTGITDSSFFDLASEDYLLKNHIDLASTKLESGFLSVALYRNSNLKNETNKKVESTASDLLKNITYIPVSTLLTRFSDSYSL